MKMVTLTADVTDGIKEMTQKLIRSGMYKSQSEVVRDAIRQLAFKYNLGRDFSLEKTRNAVAKAGKKAGKRLSDTVREIRDSP